MPGGYIFGDVNATLSDDKYPNTGLLFADNFSEGFDGWTELYESGSNTARTALSRVTFPAMTGGYALRLGTGAVGNGSKDGAATAIKRLTRVKDTGVVNFDIWWSYGAVLAVNAPQHIEFGIDTQKRDGSARSYFKVRWQQWDSGNNNLKQFGVMGTAGTIVNVPGAVYQFPFNENKQNYVYTRIRVDLTLGVQDIWVWDDHYDVSALAGTGATTADSPVTNFNGGLNFAVNMLNRTSLNLCQAWCDIDQVRGWYE